MRLERHLSLRGLVGLSLGGAIVLFVQTITMGVLTLTRSQVFSSWGWDIAFFLLPILLGFALMLTALEAIRRGMGDDLWPAEQTSRLHARLGSPAMKVILNLSLLVCVAFSALLLFGFGNLHRNHIVFGFFPYLLIYPFTTYGQLRARLAPPKTPISRWYSELKPIVSEHWGEGRS